jgi:hypothetical protein
MGNHSGGVPGRKTLAVMLAATAVTASAARAAFTNSDWVASTKNGTFNWTDSANWSAAGVPDNSNSTSGDTATIADTIDGNRTINLTSLGFAALTWSSGATSSSFVDKLQFLGDVTIGAGGGVLTIGGNASKVLDLAGHNLSMPLATALSNATSTSALSITNSGAIGSTITARNFTSSVAAVTVGSGVTLKIASPSGNNGLTNVVFQTGSAFEVAGAAGTISVVNGAPVNGFSNYVISSGAARLEVDVRVRDNFTISSSDGSTTLASMTFRTNTKTLSIGGEYRDTGTGDYGYQDANSNGRIIFDGGAATARTVSIARDALTKTSFQVGSTAVGGNDGNISLAADLKTLGGVGATSQPLGGEFRVTDGSTADLNTYTATARTVTIDAGATLGYSFSDADSGLIIATLDGGLTLNGFALTLEKAGNWTNGSNLLLMSYTGTLNGTPSLTGVTAPLWVTYGGLQVDSSHVWLTNVSLTPEPGSLVAAMGMSLLLLRRQRRGA